MRVAGGALGEAALPSVPRSVEAPLESDRVNTHGTLMLLEAARQQGKYWEALERAGVKIRYGAAPSNLTALERDFMEIESDLQAARLLTWRAAWMMDRGKRNNLEASMAKAKAGRTGTYVTLRAVELAGDAGYAQNELLEKWARDSKILDIFEGTQQIQMLVVARGVLGKTSAELR